MARAGEAPVHRPRKRHGREPEDDGDEHVRRARAASAGQAAGAAHGTWERDLATAVPPDRNVLYRGITAQPGTYRIIVDRRFIRISGPDPRGHVKIDYIAGPSKIKIGGPVWTGDPAEGGWCEPWGPEATYAWSVSGGTLMLASASKADTCNQRGAIFTGEWTRAK